MEWWAAFLKDWGDISAWSLFIGLGLAIIFGVLSDRIWSGKRGRRAEEAAEKANAALAEALRQNAKLIDSQGFAEYVFKELLPARVPPKRGTKLPGEESSDAGT